MNGIVRASGLLLPVASLPSKFGIGDFGPESRKFVSLLAKCRQRYWSILPLSPTHLEAGNSPYQTSSAYAGNPLLISPEELAKQGLIEKSTLKAAVMPQTSKINYCAVYRTKQAILREAYEHFKQTRPMLDSEDSFEAFCSENCYWLDDYALYSALRAKMGKSWVYWPPELRSREPEALATQTCELSSEVGFEKFVQYTFFSQWKNLKHFCHKKQVKIIGDMPFYVAHDSADVWANQDLFSLKRDGKARFVGGVPPDYFSDDGQLWGNPVYDWRRMEKTGFEWWRKRVGYSLKVYDFLRLDHFRGFVAYWRVAASAKTAKKGKWVKAPYQKFFAALKESFPGLPFIAEDLGAIDESVRQAISFLGVPGMKVLLFGFNGSEDNPHALGNHPVNAVVYTGTHDTNTIRGWFNTEASVAQKTNFFNQIGKKTTEAHAGFEMVKLALKSKAKLCIIPIQDVLSLDAEARINMPSCPTGNWEWRITPRQLKSKHFTTLSKEVSQAER
ncbi:MAG: 4-alpha-glucanotransferase [Candidatus Bathyarchaeia archaeon]